MWRNSAYTGNGMARVDKVEQQDLHRLPHGARARVAPTSSARSSGTSHRTASSAVTRGWRRCAATPSTCAARAKLEGAASIDIAGRVDRQRRARGTCPPMARRSSGHAARARRRDPQPARRPSLPRRRARHPGHVDRGRGRRRARAAARVVGPRARDATRTTRTPTCCARSSSTRTASVLEEHEMAQFRTQIATQTLAAARGPGRALCVRRAGRTVAAAAHGDRAPAPSQPHAQDAGRRRARPRARPRARRSSLARAARATSTLDPCKPQPITLDRRDSVELGAGARSTRSAAAWERMYEHGMALVARRSSRAGRGARACSRPRSPRHPTMPRARDGRRPARLGRRRSRAAPTTRSRIVAPRARGCSPRRSPIRRCSTRCSPMPRAA